MAGGRMTWNVRAILKICDSFTRRPASLAPLRVTVDAGLTAIRKPEGILVFVENHNYREKEQVRVRLESPVFLPREITLSLAGPPEVTAVWMVPGECYPAPASASRLYGSAPPGASLSFVFTEDTGALKLFGDYRSKDALVVCHPGILSLEGYILELEWSGRRERVTVVRQSDKPRPDTGCYQTREEPEAGPYPKKDTSVRVVYCTVASEEGRYVFFFKNLPAPEAEGRIELEAEGKRREACAAVREGKNVRLDFSVT